MLDTEIREHLAKFLSSQLTLHEFEEWFVPATWDVYHSGNLDTIRLASEIELNLAEFASGHLSEDELRDALRPLVISYKVTISTEAAASNIELEMSTSAETVQQSFGKVFAMEPV
jgi:hypothetical protein